MKTDLGKFNSVVILIATVVSDQSDWSYCLSIVILLCLLTSLTTLQSWRLPYCSLHMPVMLLSNGLSIYCFLQLCERQSNYIPRRDTFSLATGYKMSTPPPASQLLPQPSSPSLFFIYVYMKYTILYMKYIILFIHFDFCLHSLKYINSVKSRYLPVLLIVLLPLLKKVPDT